jgi:hypothetical protein
MIREIVVEAEDKPVATGDAAYRVIVPTDLLIAEHDLKFLVDNPVMTGWMGPGRHIMSYCIVSLISSLSRDLRFVDFSDGRERKRNLTWC